MVNEGVFFGGVATGKLPMLMKKSPPIYAPISNTNGRGRKAGSWASRRIREKKRKRMSGIWRSTREDNTMSTVQVHCITCMKVP